MCAMEGELEILLGELQIKMKGNTSHIQEFEFQTNAGLLNI